MREDISKIYADLREVASPILVDRLVRAVRQEKASSHIEALEKDDDPSIEKLSDYLEHEMASLLEDGLESGTLDGRNYVNDNRHTLKMIAKGAAIGFRDLNTK